MLVSLRPPLPIYFILHAQWKGCDEAVIFENIVLRTPIHEKLVAWKDDRNTVAIECWDWTWAIYTEGKEVWIAAMASLAPNLQCSSLGVCVGGGGGGAARCQKKLAGFVVMAETVLPNHNRAGNTKMKRFHHASTLSKTVPIQWTLSFFLSFSDQMIWILGLFVFEI